MGKGVIETVAVQVWDDLDLWIAKQDRKHDTYVCSHDFIACGS